LKCSQHEPVGETVSGLLETVCQTTSESPYDKGLAGGCLSLILLLCLLVAP